MQAFALTGVRRSCAFALACCFLTLVIGSKSSAQVLYGSIVGTVTDPSSALVPNVNIKATNTATGLVRETTTDSAGYYSLPNLPEGSYDLSFSGRGFRTITQTGVTVRI